MTHTFEHTVQLYENDAFLADNTAALIKEALADGQGMVIVATRNHETRFLTPLIESGFDVPGAIASGRLALLDARELLNRFMVQRWPNRKLFREHVGGLVRDSLRRYSRLTIFGEMVDLLWKDGLKDAAIRIEELWNELGTEIPFRLACAYQQHLFDYNVAPAYMNGICRAHSSATCAEDTRRLEAAFAAAVSEVLGRSRAEMLRRLFSSHVRWHSPAARLFWLRSNMPGLAERVMIRARQHYAAAGETILRS